MSISKRLRFRVLQRDGFRCRYCGADASTDRLEVDHVVPQVRGGPDDLGNLVTACWSCNRGKKHHPLPVAVLRQFVEQPIYLPAIDFPRGPTGMEHISRVVGRIYDGLDERHAELGRL